MTSFAFAILAVIAALAETEDAFGVTLLVLALLQGFAAMAILYRVAQHDRVRVQTVMGAIAVYAMIGLAASSINQGATYSGTGRLRRHYRGR